MSRRDEEKRKSLADLARIAEKAEATPWLDAKPKPAAPPPAARAPPRPAPRAPPRAPPPLPVMRAELDAQRQRRLRMEERKAKLEEEKRLKERRQQELGRGASLTWRGMSWGDVPTGVRRTPFDVKEPSVSQKIGDVLGDAKEKESRAKQREKGRRQGGR